MSLGKDILKIIKKDKVEPKAKWIFAFKNIITWLLGILSLIISSLAVSVIIHIIKNNDYLFFKMIHPSPLGLIIKTLPYFWIIALIIFIIAARYILKQTKKGYKLELYKIIILSIILSIVLGNIFYILGVGSNIDSSFAKKSPFYNQMMRPRHLMWLQEDRGMIAGQIISLSDPDHFILEDFNHKQWQVIKIENEIMRPKFEKMIPFPLNLEPGLEIRALGEKINDQIFHAFIIKPAPPFSKSKMPLPPKKPF